MATIRAVLLLQSTESRYISATDIMIQLISMLYSRLDTVFHTQHLNTAILNFHLIRLRIQILFLFHLRLKIQVT